MEANKHIASTMLTAHSSDLPVMLLRKLAYGIVDTGPMVKRAIARLAQLSPDLIVISGDLVHPVKREELQLKTMLSPLKMPVYLMSGNHNSRDRIRPSPQGLSFLHKPL